MKNKPHLLWWRRFWFLCSAVVFIKSPSRSINLWQFPCFTIEQSEVVCTVILHICILPQNMLPPSALSMCTCMCSVWSCYAVWASLCQTGSLVKTISVRAFELCGLLLSVEENIKVTSKVILFGKGLSSLSWAIHYFSLEEPDWPAQSQHLNYISALQLTTPGVIAQQKQHSPSSWENFTEKWRILILPIIWEYNVQHWNAYNVCISTILDHLVQVWLSSKIKVGVILTSE